MPQDSAFESGVGVAVGFAPHVPQLLATPARQPAYRPRFRPPAAAGPSIAPPWSPQFRLSSWLPARFALHLGTTPGGFGYAWPYPRLPEPAAKPLPLAPVARAPAPVAQALPEPPWQPEALPAPAPVPLPEHGWDDAVVADEATLVAAPRMVEAPTAPAWDAPQRRPGFRPVAAPKPTRGTRWGLLAVAAVLVPVLGVAMVLLPRLLAPVAPQGTPAVFNAPIMVLRAATGGRVQSLAVSNGGTVQPGTVLMTIHATPPADPAAGALRARLAAAKDRLAAQSAPQPPPTTDAARVRAADAGRLRLAATAEVAQLQAAIDAIAGTHAVDTPVKAGLNGRVWSVEAAADSETTPGSPLVRLVDCDHPFLTLARGGTLQAGQQVEVRMAGLPTTTGVVRPASGIAEPVGSLVVQPAQQSGPNACPVGVAATVLSAASPR